MPPRKLDLGNLARGDRVETIEFAGDLRITLRVQETAVLGSASSCINKGARMIPRDRIRVKKDYPVVTDKGVLSTSLPWGLAGHYWHVNGNIIIAVRVCETHFKGILGASQVGGGIIIVERAVQYVCLGSTLFCRDSIC